MSPYKRNRLVNYLRQSCAARNIDNPCARTHYSAWHFGGLMKFILLLSVVAIMAASSTSAFAADAEVKLSVDASKTGPPISKYIYGQFAEHLGRSIYGGLWAEMVEDRKFGWEITDEYKPFDVANDDYGKPAAFLYLKNSPWKVIGPKGTVTMDKTNPYVGEWSPVIHLPADGTDAGISQGNEPFNGAAWLSGSRGWKEVCGAHCAGGRGGVEAVTVKLAHETSNRGPTWEFSPRKRSTGLTADCKIVSV